MSGHLPPNSGVAWAAQLPAMVDGRAPICTPQSGLTVGVPGTACMNQWPSLREMYDDTLGSQLHLELCTCALTLVSISSLLTFAPFIAQWSHVCLIGMPNRWGQLRRSPLQHMVVWNCKSMHPVSARLSELMFYFWHQ